ncbi:MAG TPA: winged helix-turn-helix domain-containing protein [Jiangellaceae bacterium]
MIGGSGPMPADWPDRGHPQLSVAGVTLDVARRSVTLASAGDEIVLTPLQSAVLAHLMTHPGEVCSREELMCDALGYPFAVGSRTVDVHVATLRSKLRGAVEIRTVRGVGYALVPMRG